MKTQPDGCVSQQRSDCAVFWCLCGACRFTREVVQKRRALIGQQVGTEPVPRRKKDFVDIILLTKAGEKSGLID